MNHDGIHLQLHEHFNTAYVLTESLPFEICGR